MLIPQAELVNLQVEEIPETATTVSASPVKTHPPQTHDSAIPTRRPHHRPKIHRSTCLAPRFPADRALPSVSLTSSEPALRLASASRYIRDGSNGYPGVESLREGEPRHVSLPTNAAQIGPISCSSEGWVPYILARLHPPTSGPCLVVHDKFMVSLNTSLMQ